MTAPLSREQSAFAIVDIVSAFRKVSTKPDPSPRRRDARCATQAKPAIDHVLFACLLDCLVLQPPCPWPEGAHNRSFVQYVRMSVGGRVGLLNSMPGILGLTANGATPKALYDRVRTAVDDSLAGVIRAGAAAGCAGRDLAAVGRTAERTCDGLGPGLHDARRDVTRTLETMRHAARECEHGPERDFGPSR